MQERNYCRRWIEQPLRGTTSRGKVRLILGARQTGKSWLLRHLLPENGVLVDLQDPSERLRLERAPGTLARELKARRQRRLTVCIDEIQKVPSLLEEIQWLHDTHAGRFEFFLTGSSARRLRGGAANLLPGRSHLYRLFPVIVRERQDWKHSTLLPLASSRWPGGGFEWKPIDDLLLWGSLPGISGEPPSRRKATLEAYAEVYLEEEIRREAIVRDVGAFARFLELSALESGQTVQLTKLSQESGVPLSTLKTFYQVLADTFIGYWIEPYGRPSRKQLLTTPRFVWFDTGVRNAAARLPLEKGLLKTQAGTLFEQWLVSELVHRAAYLGRSHRVSFWRTRHGAEVDVIVETPRRDIPIEVKWTENPRPVDARHLENFLDTYPRRAREGYLVCRVPRPRRLTDRVTAIPWDAV
jgi:predicted AAA+ superfamily ATPase